MKAKQLLVVSAVLVVTTACGGGGDGDDDATAAPAPQSGSGSTTGGTGGTGGGGGNNPTTATTQAPLVPPACALYSADRILQTQPANNGIVTNRCSIPVRFRGCWVPQGATNCEGLPENRWFVSDIIEPGRSVFIPAPSANDQKLAAYTVCDVTNRNAVCSANSPSSGASQFTTLTDAQLDINGPGRISNAPSPNNTNNPPTPTTRSFITWNGNANGDVVVDATDDQFKFYSDTRCIYSVNRQQETRNFCLTNDFSGNFAGRAITVTRVRATNGQCIAGLVDVATSRYIDIFTNPQGVQVVQQSDKNPVACQ
ncbi:hypothetical protein RY831_03850 [Noviherbaspirillum sp. CPCC 100848]|uniref:Uncharacterized protein n=1 Tax=Noviherbaspirillum album TaxID=3080276 RepID=A0ABU6J3Q8_9BURK|nr:hypothetical protein [Noviherbaspirillum sp. CPCC 100848]MEC4718268.1 hypothetical protein [Noviherbaspirillum sp. CPCC 100848]